LLKPQVSPYRQRAWSPLAVSAGVHLVLLAVAAGLSRRSPASEPTERADRPADEARRIDMIYVPPVAPPPPPPPVRPAPPSPPPAVRRTAPEPEPNAPPEAARSSGAETAEEPKPQTGRPETEPAATVASPAAEQAVATLESEARRIFGRPRLVTRAGAGPQATRPMEAWLPENSERCIPHPVALRDSAGPTQFGTVTGRIFRQDNGRPLAGAHLQMIGTPYVTFTDESGEYRFQFDLALMDNCRTQYVKVSAAGYESRLLVLLVGPNRSEDVRLRRR
jgi:hypothetical protein